MQQTFSIIKPNAVNDRNIGNIIAIFEKNGLRVAGIKSLRLSREKAKVFYAEHDGKYFFEGLLDFMTSGPIVVMVLEGENAIARNRELMGATNPEEAAEGTIRKLYAESMSINAVHGSDSEASARREIALFFDECEVL